MYGIFTHIYLRFVVNVDRYSINGARWLRYWLSFVRRFDDDRVSRGRAISGVEGDVRIYSITNSLRDQPCGETAILAAGTFC